MPLPKKNLLMDEYKATGSLYSFVEHKETGEAAFRLLEGKYAGVIWGFRDIKISKIDNLEDVEEIPLSFKYEIMYKPEGLEIVKDEFGPLVAPILLETIDKQLSNNTIDYIHDENRNSGTE
jgi:hypothetical protein